MSLKISQILSRALTILYYNTYFGLWSQAFFTLLFTHTKKKKKRVVVVAAETIPK